MAYKTTSTVFAVIKEAQFNQGGTFTDADAIPATSDSSLKPEVTAIERKTRTNSFVKCPTIAGIEKGSGTLGVEIAPKGDGSHDLIGDLLFEVGLGVKEPAGAGTGAFITYESVKGNDISFSASDQKITATAEDFSKFRVGDTITVSGSTSNDGTYTIASIPATNELVVAESLVDEAAGADIVIYDNSLPIVREADATETGEANLYKLNKPCGSEASLAIMKVIGCDATDSQTLIFKGVVPGSVKLSFPTGDICTASFDLGASSFDTRTGDTVPTITCGDSNPYVGKLAKFSVDGKTYEAKNIEVTISNTVTDLETITSTGIGAKITTQKEVKGTFTVLFESYDELQKMKNNTDATLYLELSQDSGANKFAMYMGRIRYSSVDVADDNGVVVNNIEFIAYEDENKEPILIAHQVS